MENNFPFSFLQINLEENSALDCRRCLNFHFVVEIFTLWLCLVRVKAFLENIPFSRNAIFRKGKCFHVFGCISKNFPKNIFWCLEKKKEKTNPEKHGQNPEKKKSSTIDARLAMASSTRGEIAIDARLGSTARCFASYNPMTAPSIAIDSAISRSVDRDRRRGRTGLELGVRRRSLNWTGAQSSSSRALALSLSLSLSPEFI